MELSFGFRCLDLVLECYWDLYLNILFLERLFYIGFACYIFYLEWRFLEIIGRNTYKINANVWGF